MVRGGLTGKMTSEQRPERHEGGGRRNTWEKSPSGNGNKKEVAEWRERRGQ